ncbi:MAG: VWA domain-containing protein [Planctomycetota bacterium]|jgi:Mg-chelatase subunit ChlD
MRRIGLLVLVAAFLSPAWAEEDPAEIRARARQVLASSRPYDEAIPFLQYVGSLRNELTVEIGAKALRHPARPVRIVAAEILEKSRRKGAIPELIRALGKEKTETGRDAILAALQSLTGRPGGTDAAEWKKWWKSRAETFEVPPPPKKAKPKPKRKPGRRTVAKFYGIPVSSPDVVFVIDCSGSMLKRSSVGKSRWDEAVEQLRGAVDKLPKKARVNVIFFTHDIWSWRDSLTPLTRRNRAKLEAALLETKPRGGTWLYDGLAKALEDPDVETICLLSDGEASGGRYSTDADILREITKRNRVRRAVIHCVAVGYESPMLRKLAEKNGGNYVQR